MNYTEAIKMANQGKEQGFTFLYENTYKSKYYLALQYMKNKEAAEDVLQEAYLKAFSKLEKLKEPEAFEGWLGVIVANTAKNALAKKNPLLFTDVAVNDEGEEFTYDVEDEDPDNQPEMAYTREETKELVHSMMDSLSEEQRMCILMFHIEGASITEIAQAMECSENTVKSRLNYGRKNLKIKAESMQKKGYRLYSVAPVALLIWLLRSDQEAMAAEPSFIAEGKAIEGKILHQQTATSTTASAAAHAAKTGFFHTIAGKAVAGIVAACIAGGAVYGGVQWNHQKNAASAPTVTEKAAAESTEQTEEPKASGQESKSKTAESETPKTDSSETKSAEMSKPEDESPVESTVQEKSLGEIYADVLKDVQKGKYEFPDGNGSNDYYYFVSDLNDDGIADLGVAAMYTANVFYMYDMRVFTCSDSNGRYKLEPIKGDQTVTYGYLAGDGKGVFNGMLSRGTGMMDIIRIRIKNGALVSGDAEQEFRIDEPAADTFERTNPAINWISVSDTSGLKNLTKSSK